MVDAACLRELLNYDAGTGLFVWRKNGRSAGCVAPTGYVLIGISGKLYLAHRLAWLYVTGEWPSAYIDHVDRRRSNNRFTNLREATAAQNSANSGLRNTNRSGFKGVSWDKRTRKWRTTIVVGGRQRSLGRHAYLEDAACAYFAEAKAIHGTYATTDLGVIFVDLPPREQPTTAKG